MQDPESGGRPPINTAGKVDGYVLLFVVLAFRPSRGGALSRLWQRVASRLPDLEPFRPEAMGGLVWLAGVVLLFLVLSRSVLGRLMGVRRYDVVRAGFMALVGAPLWAVVAFLPILALMFIVDQPGPNWLMEVFGFLLFVLVFGCAGLWAGWRFGRRGWAWGLAGTGTTYALIVAKNVNEIAFASEAPTAVLVLAAGAAGGWLGARWFQKKHAAKAAAETPPPP